MSERGWPAILNGHGLDGLASIFDRYPVLARKIETRIEQWVVATRELIDRIEDDHRLVCRRFGVRGRHLAIVTIENFSLIVPNVIVGPITHTTEKPCSSNGATCS